MADDGRTTLGELKRGDVFRTADGLLWVRTHECLHPPDRAYCVGILHDAALALAYDRPVEPLDLPALLAELDELRTLTHDLLIDRDASVGREVGRGQAVAVLNALIETAGRLPTTIHSAAVARALSTAAGAVRALGPVRPLPPTERVAERCRALEGALREFAGAVSRLFQDPAQTFADVAALRKLLDAREAALGLLAETSGG